MKALLCTLSLLGASAAHAQQMDMDAMMKWGSADLIRYHVVGVYQGKPSIASDGSGRADVTDRVVIDFSWKLSEMKLVGAPTFQNTKTTLSNPTDREPSCLPPVLKGEYEHYELLGIKEGLSGSLEFTVQTTHPIVEVAQFCTASRKSVPAKKNVRAEDFVVVSPVTFGMPLPDSDDLRISKDKKSLIAKKNGWTWTYTPAIAPAR
ncbi:MAG TPA: hypothetical protein VIV63_09755 [Steroidobacteraceae bacterium]